MRIRLSLTLDVWRHREQTTESEPPQVDDKGSGLVEMADPHPEVDRPIGFRRDPDGWDE